jgi:tRNA(fMet)-specific endonuclease VapC
MLQYMLDTDICIYITKAHPSKLLERFNRFGPQLCVSTIVLSELYFGVEKSARRIENLEVLERFISRLSVLPFSASAAAHYGQIRIELQRTGMLPGGHDLLIGAHARSEQLTLVTNNTREFERIPGLHVENWV